MFANGAKMSGNRIKCPEKANGTSRVLPLHARHETIDPITQRTDISIAAACFPSSRIDRHKKKLPATLVEGRGEGREGDFTCHFSIFMPAWAI